MNGAWNIIILILRSGHAINSLRLGIERIDTNRKPGPGLLKASKLTSKTLHGIHHPQDRPHWLPVPPNRGPRLDPGPRLALYFIVYKARQELPVPASPSVYLRSRVQE